MSRAPIKNGRMLRVLFLKVGGVLKYVVKRHTHTALSLPKDATRDQQTCEEYDWESNFFFEYGSDWSWHSSWFRRQSLGIIF